MSECIVATPLSLLLLLLFSTQGPPADAADVAAAATVTDVLLRPIDAVEVDVADTEPLSALLLLGCCWLLLPVLVLLLLADEGTGSSVKRKAISRSRKTSVSLGSIRLKRLKWKERKIRPGL